MKTVDARGLSCPEPLIMLKNALKTEKNVILLLDSKNALRNCEDYAGKQGFSVDIAEENGTYKARITLAK